MEIHQVFVDEHMACVNGTMAKSSSCPRWKLTLVPTLRSVR